MAKEFQLEDYPSDKVIEQLGYLLADDWYELAIMLNMCVEDYAHNVNIYYEHVTELLRIWALDISDYETRIMTCLKEMHRQDIIKSLECLKERWIECKKDSLNEFKILFLWVLAKEINCEWRELCVRLGIDKMAIERTSEAIWNIRDVNDKAYRVLKDWKFEQKSIPNALCYALEQLGKINLIRRLLIRKEPEC